MSFPKAEAISTEELKELPYKEKLQIVEKDIETLYDFCINRGFTQWQIDELTEPLTGHLTESLVARVSKGSKNILIKLSILVAMLAIILQWPYGRKFVWVHAKLLSYKTLAVYDWTPLYDEDCLLENTFLPDKSFIKEDCHGCIEFAKSGSVIERLRNADHETITKDFFQVDYPFVITDVMRDWPKNDNGNTVLSIEKIKGLYLTHKELKSGLHECITQSTLEEENVTVHTFMQMLHEKKLPDKYHVSWENCVPSAAKVFRLYSKRPYFLPAMAEASRANQFAISKGSFDHEFSLPQQIDQAAWFVVLSGSVKVILHPIEECVKFKCKPATFPLKTGETAIVPTRVWEATYSPISDDEYTILFASTVVWDEVK